MENSGRKKHVVQGKVAEIRKQGEGLGEKETGNREENVLKKLVKDLGSKGKKK